MNQTTEKQNLRTILGNNARAARASLGMTQAKAAERIGVSPEFYGRVERGRAMPSLVTLKRMAIVLETAIHDLLNMPRPEPEPDPDLAH